MDNNEEKAEERTEEKKVEDQNKNIFNDVKDETNLYSKEDIDNGRVMSILAYLGILCLIPYFAEKNNKFVVFHAKEGLNLLIIEIIASVAIGIISSIFVSILWVLSIFVSLLSFAVSAGAFALSVMGIINVCNGKAKELPVINKFKIIK